MKTLVVGVSLGADRYANMACRSLVERGHETIGLGLREGETDGVQVVTGEPKLADIDTITLYVNPTRQAAMIEYLLSLEPRRVIFNPGTENAAFAERARQVGIDPIEACTLVMLASNQF
ncbi:MAG TPA: CoA-binding protein [Tepidisphaeraceae bacterium]|nr:CoA-binding protein [Tepidisphaeraceae bacterium]